jgi:hypothetical protein
MGLTPFFKPAQPTWLLGKDVTWLAPFWWIAGANPYMDSSFIARKVIKN